MPTECNPALFEFAPVEGRQVVAAFDGGAITSDAGALLLGETDRAIRLTERFTACFSDTRAVELVDASGEARVVPGARLGWRYRSSGLEGVVVVRALLELVPGDPEKSKQELALYLKKRREGTPFDEPCCGSVFRNPGGGRTAGQLIEAVGLKGHRIGGAQVSPKHANYIVNLGNATAGNVLAVIEAVRARVRAEFGIALELEVKLIE